MIDLLTHGTVLLAGLILGYIARAVQTAEVVPPPPPPPIVPYHIGTDGLDLPPYYHRVGLPGRTKEARRG